MKARMTINSMKTAFVFTTIAFFKEVSSTFKSLPVKHMLHAMCIFSKHAHMHHEIKLAKTSLEALGTCNFVPVLCRSIQG